MSWGEAAVRFAIAGAGAGAEGRIRGADGPAMAAVGFATGAAGLGVALGPGFILCLSFPIPSFLFLSLSFRSPGLALSFLGLLALGSTKRPIHSSVLWKDIGPRDNVTRAMHSISWAGGSDSPERLRPLGCGGIGVDDELGGGVPEGDTSLISSFGP